MSTVSRLREDAQSAYSGGRLRDALLLFRQAAGQAEMLGDRVAWFENLVWAASTASNLDDVPLALRLLIEARTAEPPDRPDYEATIARHIQLEITCAYRPVLSRMLKHVDELRQFPVPQADIENILSSIACLRGHFAHAREGFERAWHTCTENVGCIKESHAVGSIECCLEMRDARGARDWITALEGVVSSFDYYRRSRAIRSRLYLTLLEGGSFQKLRELLRAFEDFARLDDECRFFHVRVHLLDPDGGDPAERTHLSRQTLTHRFGSRWNSHETFARRMLLLDYRLAALRYAAGIAPVDDYYYAQPQVLPVRFHPLVADDDLAERVHKARIAADWALASAQKLDRALECDYHQRRVESRRERIEEIARLCTGNLAHLD
jgi:hypothetical protein